MSEGWLASLIPALFLLLLALFAYARSRSWLAPGTFFPMIWTGFVLLPMLGAPDYEVRAGAVWYILASNFAVYSGSLVGGFPVMLRRRTERYVARTQLHNRLGSLHFPGLNHIILASIILGLLYSLFVLRDFRRSLTVFLSFKEIFRMGHEISVARYSGVYVYSSLPTQIILSFVYVGPIFSGLSFSLNLSRSHRLIAFLSIVPALIVAVIQTTRAAILFSGILWMASYFSGSVLLERGTVHLFAKKHVLLVSFLIPLLVVVLIILLMARGNMMSLDEIPGRFLHLRSDLLGHLAVFSHWFQDLWYGDITPYFGVSTFGGIFTRLDIRPQELKLYGEAVKVGPGQWTNLYTIFLPLIKDFTPVGALLVLFAGGIVAERAYNRLAQGKVVYLPILVAFYAVTQGSFTQCIFAYNSILAAWLLLTCYILITQFLQRMRRKHKG